jgi:hypothetical protein
MLLEGRKPHMVARCEETSAAHRSGEPVTTKLHRIAEKARKEPSFTFTSLYHLLNEELIRECFKRLRSDAAAGIDKVTKGLYAEDLDANLSDLIGRLHRMHTYRSLFGENTYLSRAATNNALWWGYPYLKTSLSKRDLFGYWQQCTNKTS